MLWTSLPILDGLVRLLTCMFYKHFGGAVVKDAIETLMIKECDYNHYNITATLQGGGSGSF